MILSLSYIDDFKVKLAKFPEIFEAFNTFLKVKTQEPGQYFILHLSIVLFITNMVTDAQAENFEEQKKKFGLEDQDLSSLKNLIDRQSVRNSFYH